MLNIDELSIIACCENSKDLNKVIDELNNGLPYAENSTMQENMKSTIRKIKTMTQEEFSVLDLNNTLYINDD